MIRRQRRGRMFELCRMKYLSQDGARLLRFLKSVAPVAAGLQSAGGAHVVTT